MLLTLTSGEKQTGPGESIGRDYTAAGSIRKDRVQRSAASPEESEEETAGASPAAVWAPAGTGFETAVLTTAEEGKSRALPSGAKAPDRMILNARQMAVMPIAIPRARVRCFFTPRGRS